MSTTAEAQQHTEVLRWYTPARRIQRLIGKAPGGGHYPGGPYTVTQFVGGAVLFSGLVFTEEMWGTGTWLKDKAIAFGLTAVVVFLLGRVKAGGQNPVDMAFGSLAAATRPRHGAIAGRVIKRQRPHRARAGQIHIANAPSVRAAPAQLAEEPEEREERVVAAASRQRLRTPAMPRLPRAHLQLPRLTNRAHRRRPAPVPTAALSAVQQRLAALEEKETSR